MVLNDRALGNRVRSIQGDPYPRVSTIISSLGESGYAFYSGAKERERFLEILETQRPVEACATLKALLASRWYFAKMQKRWLARPMNDGLLADRLFPHIVREPDLAKSSIVELANHYVTEDKLKYADIPTVIRDIRTVAPWVKEMGVEMVHEHQIVVGNYGDRLGYAGEADHVIRIKALDDSRRIMDLKRTRCYRRPHGMQLAAYFFADHIYDPLTEKLSPYNWDRDCKTPALFVHCHGGRTTHRFIERHELDLAYDAFIGALKGFLWNNVSALPINNAGRLYYNGKSLKYPEALPTERIPSDEALDQVMETTHEENELNEEDPII